MDNTQQLPRQPLFKSRFCWFFELLPLITKPAGAFLGAILVTIIIGFAGESSHPILLFIGVIAIIASIAWGFYAAADWTYEYLALDQVEVRLESHKPMIFGGHGGATVKVAYIKRVDHRQTGPERWLAWATFGKINCGTVEIDTEVEENPRLKVMTRVPNHMALYNLIQGLIDDRLSRR